MEYRYHPIYKYIAFYIILYAFLKHQKIMENNALIINTFFITIFVMIVDQLFIANNLTIFQPLSDQYLNYTQMNTTQNDNNDTNIDNIYEENVEENVEENSKKKKKTKKNKINIDLTDENLYYNDDEMYYNQYYTDSQKQKPNRYENTELTQMVDNKGYDFQEPQLNSDYNFNFNIEPFNF